MHKFPVTCYTNASIQTKQQQHILTDGLMNPASKIH